MLTKSGWFAARPSGTEDIYKIYAESFKGSDHLRSILEEAQTIVSEALAVPLTPKRDEARSLSDRRQMTVAQAVEVWRNEGDPN